MPNSQPSKNTKSTKQNHISLTKTFDKVSETVSSIVGSPWWFVFSVLIIMIWIPSGFILGWGEIWHLLINTTTTILTFLMMSLLHASQNKWERKMERIQMKEKTAINAIQQKTQEIAGEGTQEEVSNNKINSIR